MIDTLYLPAQACETLDRRKGLPRSIMWPLDPALQPSDADDSDTEEQQLPPEMQAFEEMPAPAKLAALLAHLRLQHCHCLFCGVQVGILLRNMG